MLQRGTFLFIVLVSNLGLIYDTAATGYIIRGTFETPNIDAKQDLHTQKTLDHIGFLRSNDDIKGMMKAVLVFVKSRRTLPQNVITSLFTQLKSVIMDKRKEVQEWKLQSHPVATRYVMIDLPTISIGLISREVDEFCTQVIELIEKYLLPSEKEATLQCSYITLKADYLRYMAEFSNSYGYKGTLSARALEEYRNAEKCARNLAGLSDSNEILLGILLNRSVLEYEIMENKSAARETCLRAMENAHRKPSGISKLLGVATQLSDPAICVLQSIKRNVEVWNLGVSNQEIEDEWIMCDVSNV